MDSLDRKIIARLCGDLGESLNPFAELAGEFDIPLDELLARIRAYQQSGAMRRFGAILRHHRAGITANGMTVWNVPDDDVERVGAIMAARQEITHSYQRPRLSDWRYNLYAMIHAGSEQACRALAARLSADIGIDDYDILFSEREFKKTSMVYLAESDT